MMHDHMNVKSLRNLAWENSFTKESMWIEVLKVTLFKVAVIHELEPHSGAKSELHELDPSVCSS
jgi:hypothetical protein